MQFIKPLRNGRSTKPRTATISQLESTTDAMQYYK